ncbi:hypothetical protein L1887_24300 [Cichorium endivia]|nr:hypothetical protein L1887_24300 [Cichorium endivia]
MRRRNVEDNSILLSPGRVGSGQKVYSVKENEPIMDDGLNESFGNNQDNSGQPNKQLEDKREMSPVRTESNFIQSGEVSDKLKKLHSRKMPIEEKLEMMGRDLTETQRKIRVKEGRVNNSSTMERRITRSQSKKGRKENENEGGGSKISGSNSDKSMSIGVLQRLEEIGNECGMQQGRDGGKSLGSNNMKGSVIGKS